MAIDLTSLSILMSFEFPRRIVIDEVDAWHQHPLQK